MVLTERLLRRRVVKHAAWECVSHCVGLQYLHRIPTAPVTKWCVNALLHLQQGVMLADEVFSLWRIYERAAVLWFMSSPVAAFSQLGLLQFELSATHLSEMQPCLGFVSVKHPLGVTHKQAHFPASPAFRWKVDALKENRFHLKLTRCVTTLFWKRRCCLNSSFHFLFT